MPLQRYLLVEGFLDENGSGRLVSDPRAGLLRTGAQARYLGWKLKPQPPKDPDFMSDLFDPSPEIVLDHGDIRRAIKKGDLLMHGEVTARSYEEAGQKFQSKPKADAEPVGEEGGEQ